MTSDPSFLQQYFASWATKRKLKRTKFSKPASLSLFSQSQAAFCGTTEVLLSQQYFGFLSLILNSIDWNLPSLPHFHYLVKVRQLSAWNAGRCLKTTCHSGYCWNTTNLASICCADLKISWNSWLMLIVFAILIPRADSAFISMVRRKFGLYLLCRFDNFLKFVGDAHCICNSNSQSRQCSHKYGLTLPISSIFRLFGGNC